MIKKLQTGIILLLCGLLFSFHAKHISGEKFKLQGWWKNDESKTFLLIKGNKAIEYKISETHILSRTHFKILKINKGRLEMKLTKLKSTSFPYIEGTCLVYDCIMESEDSFICKIKLMDSNEEELFNTRFLRINESEFEDFVEFFNDKYKTCLASNWGNPVN